MRLKLLALVLTTCILVDAFSKDRAPVQQLPHLDSETESLQIYLSLPLVRHLLGSYDGVDVATLLSNLVPEGEKSLKGALLTMLTEPGLENLVLANALASGGVSADFPGSFRLSGDENSFKAVREKLRPRFPEAMQLATLAPGRLDLNTHQHDFKGLCPSGESPSHFFRLIAMSASGSKTQLSCYIPKGVLSNLSFQASSDATLSPKEAKILRLLAGGPARAFDGLALLPETHTPALGCSRTPSELLAALAAADPKAGELVAGLKAVSDELGTGGLFSSLAQTLEAETILAFRPDLAGHPLTPVLMVRVKKEHDTLKALEELATIKPEVAAYGCHKEGNASIHYLAPNKGLPIRPSFMLLKGYLAMALEPEHLIPFLTEPLMGNARAWKNTHYFPAGSLILLSRSDRLSSFVRSTRPHQAAALIGAWEKATGRTLEREPDPFKLADDQGRLAPLGIVAVQLKANGELEASGVLPSTAPFMLPFLIDGMANPDGVNANVSTAFVIGIVAGVATPAFMSAKNEAEQTRRLQEGK